MPTSSHRLRRLHIVRGADQAPFALDLLVSRGDVGSHVPAVRRLQIGLRTVPGVGGVPVILMSGSDGLLTLLARHCPER